MGTILCCYIKGERSKLFQEDPHLPMEYYYAAKSQGVMWWDIMMQVCISLHCNQWKIAYLKEGTSKKIGTNMVSSFIEM